MTDNVLLAGIPRSGTTLACALLNKLPDTLALVEPMSMGGLLQARDAPERLRYLQDFLRETRLAACRGGKVFNQTFRAGTGDNTFGKERSVTGLRQPVISRERIAVGKALSQDFTLVVKHPNAFAALLPELTAEFRCFALVRNPIAVLASWNSVDLPLREGHAPMAERLDARLAKRLGSLKDRIDRQLELLGWYYRQFEELLPHWAVLHYEDLVISCGRSLAVITPEANQLREPLSSRNSNCLYSPDLLAESAKRLLERKHGSLSFYSHRDIEQLAALLAG